MNSCQAPTWTSVRLQTPEHQLCFAKTPILDFRSTNSQGFQSCSVLRLQPNLVYTGMLLHSIQLRFSHPYSSTSVASTASAASVASTPSAASVASSLVLHHTNSIAVLCFCCFYAYHASVHSFPLTPPLRLPQRLLSFPLCLLASSASQFSVSSVYLCSQDTFIHGVR